MADRLLRIPKVAEIIDTSVPRAYELARLGIIPGVVRLGRQIRVNPDALAEWIARGGSLNADNTQETEKGAMNYESPAS
jgi:predicted DNA-binding transcriptional regulator AlpA